jgi:WYL domain
VVEQDFGLSWGVERRLEFIEFRLFWEGGVNRSDITSRFDVSIPQASKDLTLYQERAPLNAVYDKSAKRYIASEKFVPIFLKLEADSYLSRLRSQAEGLVDASASWISHPPQTDVAITPRRSVDIKVLQAVLAALRKNESISVYYQSMSIVRSDPLWRQMTPHAFGYDGLRWHVRSYCHTERKFKDFLLPRILEVGLTGVPGPGAKQDRFWQETFDIAIKPHPDLTPSQQAVVAKDYGMIGNSAVLTVRYAMLFYVLKRLGLLNDPYRQNPRTQHIVAINYAETKLALELTDFDDSEQSPP